jgi:hypothetical protein
MATSALGEVVAVEFEGVVSASGCVVKGRERLAEELARPGEKVRGRFEYDTAPSSKQRGANAILDPSGSHAAYTLRGSLCGDITAVTAR